MTFRTAKNLCPNLQKPPLPSKIPGYAPDNCNDFYQYCLTTFEKMFCTYDCFEFYSDFSIVHNNTIISPLVTIFLVKQTSSMSTDWNHYQFCHVLPHRYGLSSQSSQTQNAQQLICFAGRQLIVALVVAVISSKKNNIFKFCEKSLCHYICSFGKPSI